MKQYINDKGEYFDGKSVIYDGRLYISPSEDILIAAGYHEVVIPEQNPLDVAKSHKLAEIDAYDQSDDVNLFYLSGQPMWLDAQTRQTLRTSIDSYVALGIGQVTKWFNGQQFTFPTQAWLSMLNALEVYAAEALNVTESHKVAINAMTNIEDIENYDITTGYPEKLNLTAEWLRQLSQE